MEATTTVRARTVRAKTDNKARADRARTDNKAKADNKARAAVAKEAKADKVIPNPPRALHPVPTPTPMPRNNLVPLLHLPHLPLHLPRHQAPHPPLVKQTKVVRDRMVTPNRPVRRKEITRPHPRTSPKATLRAGPLPPPPPPPRAEMPSVASRPPRLRIPATRTGPSQSTATLSLMKAPLSSVHALSRTTRARTPSIQERSPARQSATAMRRSRRAIPRAQHREFTANLESLFLQARRNGGPLSAIPLIGLVGHRPIATV